MQKHLPVAVAEADVTSEKVIVDKVYLGKNSEPHGFAVVLSDELQGETVFQLNEHVPNKREHSPLENHFTGYSKPILQDEAHAIAFVYGEAADAD